MNALIDARSCMTGVKRLSGSPGVGHLKVRQTSADRAKGEMAQIPLSVLIITRNEQLHIERAIRSVVDWAGEVFVVDAYSTDRTTAIAEQLGATVIQHEYRYQAQQKNWALHNLPFSYDWLLLIDADEWVPDSLRDEIIEWIKEDGGGYGGFWIPYRLMFYGKWIRHCGWYPTYLLRLVRRSVTRIEDRYVDEHAIVEGRTARLKNDLTHESLQDMNAWVSKHLQYATGNASVYAELRSGYEQSERLQPRFFGTQAERKRWIKEKLWFRLPCRAILYFMYLYIVRLGFLDGSVGFRFCAMHAIFEYFNVFKTWELVNFKDGAPEGSIRVKRPIGSSATDEA